MPPQEARPGRDQGDSVPPPDPDAFAVEEDGLRYELDGPLGRAGRKTVVRVRLAAGGDALPLVDRIDLVSYPAREKLAGRVAEKFGRTAGPIMGALALLLDQAERASLVEKKPGTVTLTPARREAAEKLLRAPDLLDRAAAALEALGYVGEESNKRLVYLVATSRLLAKPLSALLRAESSSGKSELLERVAQLMPEESVEFLSRLTPQALYYAGEDHLRHKLVLVDEQAGASEADYPIRSLQSRGSLKLSVPVKGKTESIEVRGPIALLSGTTQDDLNPENLSRCLELELDDSPEQTRRVQEAQRRACSGAKPVPLDLQRWQDAQRLLEPLDVVIPYAERLDFPARTTRHRRDNLKLLSLVKAHALLHQLRRERDAEGRVIATVEDYRAVHGLLRPLVERELADLSPRAATLYRALAQDERPSVSRNEVAELLRWGYNTAKRALQELAEHELVSEVGHEMPRAYALVDRSLLGAGGTLTDPDTLE